MPKIVDQVQLDVVNDELSGRMMVEVSVRCRSRPGLISKARVDVTERNLRMRVGIMAGAIAEQHCERYQDTSDPAEIARVAEAAFPHLGIPS